MKKITIFLFTVIMSQWANAQSPLLDSAKNELYQINKTFDSSRYLAFDLGIYYKSDSATVTLQTDRLDGNYVLNQKNIYYQMGSTIYLQTDSFAYNIYPEEKMMMMTKNFIPENSDIFPLRTFVDTMMYYYSASYNITIDTIAVDSFDVIKRIRFSIIQSPAVNDSDVVLYNYFYIDYDPNTYHPIKFEFSYNEETQSVTLDSLGNNTNSGTYMATRTITMNFSNYRGFMDTGIFADSRYVYYNRQRKIFEPASQYRDYQFNTSGFDNEDEDAQYYREVPAGQPDDNN